MIKKFKELTFCKKVIYLILTFILTIIIMIGIYSLIHLIKWVIV